MSETASRVQERDNLIKYTSYHLDNLTALLPSIQDIMRARQYHAKLILSGELINDKAEHDMIFLLNEKLKNLLSIP